MHEHRLSESRIRIGSSLRRVGGRFIVLEETPSTNDVALTDGGDGTVVLAEWQSAGRGRLGRRWESPRGASILCTVGIRGGRAEGYRRRLALAVPVAICQAIADVTSVLPSVRWPNDIFVRGRKVGGVLIESRPRTPESATYAIGMGINCLQHASHFPPALRNRATSLEMEAPHHVDRHEVIRALLGRLDGWLAGDAFLETPRLLAAWHEWSSIIGHRVCLMRDGAVYEGVAVEVDVDAGLVVQLDTGGRRLFDGDSTSVIEHVATNTGATEWRRRNLATAWKSPQTG